MKRLYELHIILALVAGVVSGQSVYDPEERFSRHGARAASFAGAYVSEIYDVSAMYWNPAAISHLQRRTVVWNYLQEWGGKAKTELLAFPLLSGYMTTIAAGFNAAQIVLEDEQQNERLALLYGIDLATGFRIAPTFSIGVLGSLKYNSLTTMNEWSASSSIGVFYAPSPEISYGMMFSGIGRAVSFVASDDSILLDHASLPKRLHLGLTMRFPSSRSNRIVSIILANDKTFGQPGIRYNGAIEWSLSQYFDLRAGYVVSPTYAGAKYGIGTRTTGVQFDYALSPSRLTNRFHEFTFTILM